MPTTHRIKYRAPDAGDIAALLSVERECFDSYYRAHRFSEQQFRYYLRKKNTIASVATIGGAVAGYVLGVTQRGQRKDISRLYSIAVVAKARRHGIGRLLLRRFAREAKKRGASRIALEVAVENSVARKLFDDEGFTRTRSLPGYYGTRHDGIRMEKRV